MAKWIQYIRFLSFPFWDTYHVSWIFFKRMSDLINGSNWMLYDCDLYMEATECSTIVIYIWKQLNTLRLWFIIDRIDFVYIIRLYNWLKFSLYVKYKKKGTPYDDTFVPVLRKSWIRSISQFGHLLLGLGFRSRAEPHPANKELRHSIWMKRI